MPRRKVLSRLYLQTFYDVNNVFSPASRGRSSFTASSDLLINYISWLFYKDSFPAKILHLETNQPTRPSIEASLVDATELSALCSSGLSRWCTVRVHYLYCICTRLGHIFSMRSSISAALVGLPCASSKCAQCRCSSGLSRWCTVQARSRTSRSVEMSSGFVSERSSRNFISCLL